MNTTNPWEVYLGQRFPSICTNIACGAYAPPGWYQTIESCLEDLIEITKEHNANLQIEQIKIKWGGLRIYTHTPNEKMRKLIYQRIREAEAQTGTLCHVCGGTGTRIGMQVLCDDHMPE